MSLTDAVNVLTRILALGWAPYNICVNAVGPGDYPTARTDASWTDLEGRKRHLEWVPFRGEGDLRELGTLRYILPARRPIT